MRDYELLYIMPPDSEEGQLEAVRSRIRSVIEGQGGSVEKVDVWGRRRMAYEINGHRDGHYTLIQFKMPPAGRTELEHTLRLTEGIMRHLITRIEPVRRPAAAAAGAGDDAAGATVTDGDDEA